MVGVCLSKLEQVQASPVRGSRALHLHEFHVSGFGEAHLYVLYVSGPLREDNLFVYYVSRRLWEAHLYVFYVSGRAPGGQVLTTLRARVGPLERRTSRVRGGRVSGGSGRLIYLGSGLVVAW